MPPKYPGAQTEAPAPTHVNGNGNRYCLSLLKSRKNRVGPFLYVHTGEGKTCRLLVDDDDNDNGDWIGLANSDG